MKRFLAITLIISVFSNTTLAKVTRTDSCDLEATSRSFLSIHPHFQSSSPEMVSSFRSDRMHAREDGKHGTIQFVLLGSRTTNDKDLARYFFPFGKESLVVREDSDFEFEDTDLSTQHFNIFTSNENFHSRITIEPN